ncbi:DUF2939 domain-containing protein, partial [Sporomusa sp.]|uniref:DUF2939 domain-containing protein n=1 Tax=Sporomusa sp. TaxID=2078658 RepID=UPI002BFC2199
MMNITFNIKMPRNIIILIVCLLLSSSVIGGYYFYWTKTPEYSLKIIQEAVQKHDLEKFKMHVDMDTLTSHAVDDLFSDSISKASNNKEANIFAAGFLQLLKPTIVNVVKEKVTYYVENGNAKKTTSTKQQPNDKNIALTDKE